MNIFQKEMINSKGINYERLSEVNSSKPYTMKPNLEFTLGRPQWHYACWWCMIWWWYSDCTIHFIIIMCLNGCWWKRFIRPPLENHKRKRKGKGRTKDRRKQKGRGFEKLLQFLAIKLLFVIIFLLHYILIDYVYIYY